MPRAGYVVSASNATVKLVGKVWEMRSRVLNPISYFLERIEKWDPVHVRTVSFPLTRRKFEKNVRYHLGWGGDTPPDPPGGGLLPIV